MLHFHEMERAYEWRHFLLSASAPLTASYVLMQEGDPNSDGEFNPLPFNELLISMPRSPRAPG